MQRRSRGPRFARLSRDLIRKNKHACAPACLCFRINRGTQRRPQAGAGQTCAWASASFYVFSVAFEFVDSECRSVRWRHKPAAIAMTIATAPRPSSAAKIGMTNSSQSPNFTPAAAVTAISAPLVGVTSSVRPAPY